MVNSLIQKGANINLVDSDGQTSALHLAAANGTLSSFQAVFQRNLINVLIFDRFIIIPSRQRKSRIFITKIWRECKLRGQVWMARASFRIRDGYQNSFFSLYLRYRINRQIIKFKLITQVTTKWSII